MSTPLDMRSRRWAAAALQARARAPLQNVCISTACCTCVRACVLACVHSMQYAARMHAIPGSFGLTAAADAAAAVVVFLVAVVVVRRDEWWGNVVVFDDDDNIGDNDDDNNGDRKLGLSSAFALHLAGMKIRSELRRNANPRRRHRTAPHRSRLPLAACFKPAAMVV